MPPSSELDADTFQSTSDIETIPLLTLLTSGDQFLSPLILSHESGALTVPVGLDKEPFVNKLSPDTEVEEPKDTVSLAALIVIQFVESLLTCHV